MFVLDCYVYGFKTDSTWEFYCYHSQNPFRITDFSALIGISVSFWLRTHSVVHQIKINQINYQESIKLSWSD